MKRSGKETYRNTTIPKVTAIHQGSGKQKWARLIKEGCGQGCRYKCHQKFDQGSRETIFHDFYQVCESYQEQAIYLLDKMKSHEVVRSTKGVNQKSGRKKSVEYYLPKGDLPVRVCKAFFHAMLDIINRKTRYLLGKAKSSTVPSRNMRGRPRETS